MFNDIKSQLKEVVFGDPQGSVLEPLLFFILISNINEGVSESLVSSFADDTRIDYPIGDLYDIAKLQTDLNSIFKWANQNNMKFNTEKF